MYPFFSTNLFYHEAHIITKSRVYFEYFWEFPPYHPSVIRFARVTYKIFSSFRCLNPMDLHSACPYFNARPHNLRIRFVRFLAWSLLSITINIFYNTNRNRNLLIFVQHLMCKDTPCDYILIYKDTHFQGVMLFNGWK